MQNEALILTLNQSESDKEHQGNEKNSSVSGFEDKMINIQGKRGDQKNMVFEKETPLVLFILDTEGIIKVFEGRNLDTFNINPQDVCGTSIFDVYPDKPVLLEYIRQALISGRNSTHFELNDSVYEMYIKQVKENAKRKSTLGVIIDLTEKTNALQQLNFQKSYFQEFFESSPEAIVILDNNDCVININHGFEKLFQYTLEEVRGKSRDEILVPENLMGEAQTMISKLHHGEVVKLETIRRRKDGSLVDVLILGNHIELGPNFSGGYLIYSDISSRKRSEEQTMASLLEKETLLKEIHHRVKNNLQVVSSLLYLQSKSIKDENVAAIFKECQNRVKSISLIHEKLYQTKDLSRIDFDKYIKSLVSYLFKSFDVNPEQISLRIKSENIFMSTDTAIPCGLIINELITNSLKYAFPNGRKGMIGIDVTYHTDNKFTLIVQDNGIGLPDSIDVQHTESLGLLLVQSLVNQLDASIEIERTGGTKFKIIFSILKYKGGYK
jgi:PAS domain S-box-containing protein